MRILGKTIHASDRLCQFFTAGWHISSWETPKHYSIPQKEYCWGTTNWPVFVFVSAVPRYQGNSVNSIWYSQFNCICQFTPRLMCNLFFANLTKMAGWLFSNLGKNLISNSLESDMTEQTLKFLGGVGFQPRASSMPTFGLNLAQFFSQPTGPYPGYDQARGYGA